MGFAGPTLREELAGYIGLDRLFILRDPLVVDLLLAGILQGKPVRRPGHFTTPVFGGQPSPETLLLFTEPRVKGIRIKARKDALAFITGGRNRSIG
jgi:hypothetical protein